MTKFGPPVTEAVAARVVSQPLWTLSLDVSRGLEDSSGKRVPSTRTDRWKGWGTQARVSVFVPDLGAGTAKREEQGQIQGWEVSAVGFLLACSPQRKMESFEGTCLL